MNKICHAGAAAVICLMFVLLTACSMKRGDTDGKDIDFTVVENSEIPEELKSIIDEQKEKPFRLTYGTKDYLYICVGYGKMDTGGYSISVDKLYLTDDAIYVDTNLIGPSKGESVTDTSTTPFIVIKTEYYDQTVMFE